MPQTGLNALVADPELAAIQRRRDMIAQLLRGNQVQDFRSPMSPLAPMANALAMALTNHYGQREETQLFDRRRGEEAEFTRNNPNPLAALLGGAPGPSAPPSLPTAPEGPPAGMSLPTGSATALPQTPGGRPMFSRMPDSQPAPEGQGFDPRQRNQDFAAMRARAMDTLQGDALAQELARISAAQAQQGSGLVPGASYRRPGPGSEGGAWDAPLASGPSGAVPAFGSGGPQAIPIQAPAGGVPRPAAPGGAPAPATGVQQPPSPAAGGITQDRAQAAAMALMQQYQAALRSDNPRIRALAPGLRDQAQMALSLARQEAPVNMSTASPGSSIINPRTGQVVGQIPREPSDDERRDRRLAELRGIATRTPAQEEEFQDLRQRQRGGGVSVSVPVNTERSMYGEMGQRGGARIDTMQEQATSGVQRVESGQRIMQLLRSGVITGTGAGAREAIERAFATAGLVDGTRVANTGQLMSELAQGTLEASGALRGPTSDRDIMFLREVAAGRIDLTPETIRRVTQVSMDRATRQITQWNRMAESIQRDPNAPQLMRELYRPIQIPTVDALPDPQQPRRGAPQGQPGPGGTGTAEPPQGGPAPVRVRTPEEARRLPSGTRIILPDGRPGVVP